MNFRRTLLALLIAASGCSLEDDLEIESTGEPVATSNLVINEFTAGSSGKIEIYNGTAAAIDASGWQVDDVAGGGTSPKTLVAGSVVPAGGLLLVTYAGINTASADSVRLVNAGGTEIDAHSNAYAGSSTAGLCFGREPDGGAWAAGAIACTLGTSNGAPACLPGECAAPAVTINEFQAGSSGWIELYNAGATAADLTGWQVDDIAGGGTAPKGFAAGAQVPAGGTLSIAFSGINTASADQVRLVDDAGDVVDTHSNFWTSSSISGLCFGRRPDGGAWAASAIACTRDASNCSGGVDCGGQVTPGDGTHVLLRGTVVGPSGPYVGELLVEGDTITCAATSCAGQPGAATATVVDTHGIIFPGLIDVHNHILYDIFDETDWAPTQAYSNHNQWPNDARYKAMVDAKQYLNGEGSSTWDFGCEMDKYGELKSLVAGVTSVVGAAIPTNRSCYGSLARTIDQTPNDLGFDGVQTSALFPITTSTADAVCANIAAGTTASYLAHVAEGTDAVSRAEFAKLGTVTTTDGCLYAPPTGIVHGTALQEPELHTMADSGMSLVWSPRVNVFLYGGGTDLAGTSPDVPLARALGINVTLGADWSVGGSQNLLDELRFANQVDDTVFGNQLSPRDLAEMATRNAAIALGLGDLLGSLEVGKKADLLVVSGDPLAPYDALLAATPAQVRMTMVGGVVLYGDLGFVSAAPAAPGCEQLVIAGATKFLCVAEAGGTAANKLGQTYAEIVTALTQALQAYDDLNLSVWNFSPITPLVR